MFWDPPWLKATLLTDFGWEQTTLRSSCKDGCLLQVWEGVQHPSMCRIVKHETSPPLYLTANSPSPTHTHQTQSSWEVSVGVFSLMHHVKCSMEGVSVMMPANPDITFPPVLLLRSELFSQCTWMRDLIQTLSCFLSWQASLGAEAHSWGAADKCH